MKNFKKINFGGILVMGLTFNCITAMNQHSASPAPGVHGISMLNLMKFAKGNQPAESHPNIKSSEMKSTIDHELQHKAPVQDEQKTTILTPKITRPDSESNIIIVDPVAQSRESITLEQPMQKQDAATISQRQSTPNITSDTLQAKTTIRPASERIEIKQDIQTEPKAQPVEPAPIKVEIPPAPDLAVVKSTMPPKLQITEAELERAKKNLKKPDTELQEKQPQSEGASEQVASSDAKLPLESQLAKVPEADIKKAKSGLSAKEKIIGGTLAAGALGTTALGLGTVAAGGGTLGVILTDDSDQTDPLMGTEQEAIGFEIAE